MDAFLPYAQFGMLVIIALLNLGRRDATLSKDIAQLQKDLQEQHQDHEHLLTLLDEAKREFRSRSHLISEEVQKHSIQLAVIESRLGIQRHPHRRPNP